MNVIAEFKKSKSVILIRVNYTPLPSKMLVLHSPPLKDACITLPFPLMLKYTLPSLEK